MNLGGTRWDGDGIDVETSNGGVTVAVPEGYNAQLETRTVNGGFRSDIPLTIQGELSSRRGVSAQLGAGGPAAGWGSGLCAGVGLGFACVGLATLVRASTTSNPQERSDPHHEVAERPSPTRA